MLLPGGFAFTVFRATIHFTGHGILATAPRSGPPRYCVSWWTDLALQITENPDVKKSLYPSSDISSLVTIPA
jgi:hypothetical protein